MKVSKSNNPCYLRLRIRPRHLRDVSQRSTSTKVFGFDSRMPIGIAPTAMHRMAHHDGEIATAKGSRFIKLFAIDKLP